MSPPPIWPVLPPISEGWLISVSTLSVVESVLPKSTPPSATTSASEHKIIIKACMANPLYFTVTLMVFTPLFA